jgi:hypothetical protein
MALFSRRELQARINEVAKIATSEQLKQLVTRLNGTGRAAIDGMSGVGLAISASAGWPGDVRTCVQRSYSVPRCPLQVPAGGVCRGHRYGIRFGLREG